MAGVTSKEDKVNSHVEAAVERVETVTNDPSESTEAARASSDQDSQPDQSAGGDRAGKSESMSDEVYTEFRHDLDRDPVLKLDDGNDNSPRTSSIAIRKGTAGPVYPGLKATNWENQTSSKPAASCAVISMLMLMGFCLGALGYFEYRLKTQIDDLRSSVSALTATANTVGDSRQHDAIEKNLAFGQMNDRLNGFAARVGDLNGGLVRLNEKISEGFEIRSNESENRFQAVADQMNSLQAEINRMKLDVAKRTVQTAAPVKPPSNQRKQPDKEVQEKLNARTPQQDKPQVTSSSVNNEEQWILNLASAKQREAMESLKADFEAKGIDARLTNVLVGQTEWYRLRVSGFATKEEATQFGERTKKMLGIERYWIGR